MRLAEKAAHGARKREIHGPANSYAWMTVFQVAKLPRFRQLDLSASVSSFYTANLKKT
ncbi:MAG: hypothetical protein ACR2IE_02715 [Candidatus Sumerlaeaceae bacterium]